MKKPRVRNLTWSDYSISKAKYQELKYFCMQYPEKKRAVSYGLSAVQYTGMPKGTSVGSPTEQQALRNARLQQEIELIEQTAIEASAEIYPWLLQNVTEGIGYDYLDVPMSRSDFYGYRRYFFYLLAQKR